MQMISLSKESLALMNAAVARVNLNDSHRFNSDADLTVIGLAIGSPISVYDTGKVGQQSRFIRFDFDAGSIEILVKPRPEPKAAPELIPDNDGDGGTPGTPVITQLAQAA